MYQDASRLLEVWLTAREGLGRLEPKLESVRPAEDVVVVADIALASELVARVLALGLLVLAGPSVVVHS
jgi:uncharacterized protein YaiI (UPF0178 family)